jgi:Bardet-Biedl syndrome 4 protein
MNWIVNILFLR